MLSNAPNESTKNAERRRILMHRRQLTPSQVNQASIQCVEKIVQSDIFKRSQHIAFYAAIGQEINPAQAQEAAQEAGKTCYLPRLHAPTCTLAFYPVDTHSTLINNQYGIPEPAPMPGERPYPPQALDLVFLPLVAFDQAHNRIGMGKGYYDRSFAFIKTAQKNKPLLVGLAYTFQCIETIPVDTWDIRVHHVMASEAEIK